LISPLLTDLYQLTMAYGYWKLGMHEREALFQLIYRKNPFNGSYAIACGLDSVIAFLENWSFHPKELAYLATLRSDNGDALFPDDFLHYLGTLRFTGDIDAVPEGNIVFPHAPLLRVKAPLIQGQLLESTLMNIMNFQTLVATKATRVCRAAEGEPVLEFGLRRAQGPDGALSASRASYVGGCVGTSNVLAGLTYDIPVKGTHGHSWVSAFVSEMAAFTAYAEVMPHNLILLVDTYDTLAGVKHAIEIGIIWQQKGSTLQGIRLDSGDLAVLSQAARKLLDAAGFTETVIIASNSLDEYTIAALKAQGAKISVWGVGTSLVTAYDHPALDGVYKLAALRSADGIWEYKLKISAQRDKISNPGGYRIKRYLRKGLPVMDKLYEPDLGEASNDEPVYSVAPGQLSYEIPEHDEVIELLVPVFLKGLCVYERPSIHASRALAMAETKKWFSQQASCCPVTLDQNLHNLKISLIQHLSA
jgi:nicotinate phosphoribosyltransferase